MLQSSGQPKQATAEPRLRGHLLKRSIQLLLLSAFRRRVGSLWEDKDFDSLVRQQHIHVFAFSMVGLIDMITVQLVTWYVMSTGSQYEDAYIFDPTLQASMVDLLYVSQTIMTSSTIITVIMLFQKYRFLLTMKRAEWSGTHLAEVEDLRGDNAPETPYRFQILDNYDFWSTNLKWWFLAECFIQIPHPFIWMAHPDSSTTPTNLGYKILQIWMFFRLYSLPGIIHLMSEVYRRRFEIVTHDAALLRVCYRVSPSLTLKIFFYNYTAICVSAALLGMILIFGFGVFTMERVPGSSVSLSTLSDYWNDIWFSFVSATTIGYGDYVPSTPFGRVIAGVDITLGISLLLLFTGVLVSQFSLSKAQKQAVEFIATRTGDEQYREAARNLRTAFLMDVCMPQWDPAFDNSKERTLMHKGNRLLRAIRELRAARQELNGSLMQPNDTVVGDKVQALDELMLAIRREVDAQNKAMQEFDQRTAARLRGLIQKLSRYRREENL